MKKILFAFFMGVLVVAAQAEPSLQQRQGIRQKRVHEYLTRTIVAANLNKENEFGDTPLFEAAQKGDVNAILRYGNESLSGAFLLQKGKNGNNVFHVARNAQTFQALARMVRKFYPQDYKIKIRQMMNQRNDLGETPVHAQINYGRSDTFMIAFPYTELYERMMSAKSKLDKGGVLAEVAKTTEVEEVVKLSKDASGRTIAQAARDNVSTPGMDRVVAFFAHNASYL